MIISYYPPRVTLQNNLPSLPPRIWPEKMANINEVRGYLGFVGRVIIVLQMELPLGNFFEVTINSNKLYSFMEDIMRKLDTQEARIDELVRRIGSAGSSVDDKLKLLESALMVELEKVKKLGQQDANYLKLFVRDVDKKATEKMAELETAIGQLSNKINTSRAALEEDIAIKLSYLEKKISNLPSVEELNAKVSAEISKIASKVAKIEEISQQSQSNFESHFKRHTEMNENILERLNRPDMQSPKLQMQNCVSIASSFREGDSRSQSKRRNRSNRKDTLFQQLEGLSAAIGQKIDDMEGRMGENPPQIGQGRSVRRSIISNNKVVKYHDNLNKVAGKSAFSNKNQNRIKTLQTNLLDKLTKIEDLSISRIAMVEKQLIKQTNKSQIIDQHIGILSRKLQKEKARIAEVSDIVKITNDKKVDEKVIEGIRNVIKKMSKDFQQAIQSKVQRQTYQGDRAKLFQRIQVLGDLVGEKADKAEVKKGLSFLEEKVKEIIIVVAEEKASHQDGAIKKTPFKCLSCDKDLESERFEALSGNNRLNKENSANNLRSVTTQMRKRIRLINNTVSTVNGDD